MQTKFTPHRALNTALNIHQIQKSTLSVIVLTVTFSFSEDYSVRMTKTYHVPVCSFIPFHPTTMLWVDRVSRLGEETGGEVRKVGV